MKVNLLKAAVYQYWEEGLILKGLIAKNVYNLDLFSQTTEGFSILRGFSGNLQVAISCLFLWHTYENLYL